MFDDEVVVNGLQAVQSFVPLAFRQVKPEGLQDVVHLSLDGIDLSQAFEPLLRQQIWGIHGVAFGARVEELAFSLLGQPHPFPAGGRAWGKLLQIKYGHVLRTTTTKEAV